MDSLLAQINEVLKLNIDGNDTLEIWRYDLIYKIIVPESGWDAVQEALFQILLGDSRTQDEYTVISQVFWEAVCDKLTVDKDRAVALLNYRLNTADRPYEDNLTWSITCNLYHLDYADSEYNAFRDEKIRSLLAGYGITYEL